MSLDFPGILILEREICKFELLVFLYFKLKFYEESATIQNEIVIVSVFSSFLRNQLIGLILSLWTISVQSFFPEIFRVYFGRMFYIFKSQTWVLSITQADMLLSNFLISLKFIVNAILPAKYKKFHLLLKETHCKQFEKLSE
jgi:hypothetical protein